MKSVAMVQIGARQFEERRIEIPPVGLGQGLLRVEACGLCGSDVEQYRGRFAEKGLVSYPIIPGHEAIGIIEEIGPEAARAWGVKRGDRVALEPHLPCTRCHHCLGGTYHLCRSVAPELKITSYGYLPLSFEHGLWGGYSQYIHLREHTLLHKIPAGLPVEFATMYQPIASGIRWAVHVPKTSFGDTVLILGCGQRGLGAVLACRQAGVKTIIITGLRRDAFKLNLAKRFGAHHLVIADEEDVVERAMELTNQRGVDVVLDVTPAASKPVVDAVEAVRIGGKIVLAGLKGGDTKIALDTDRIVTREIGVQGVFTQGAEAYEQALDLLIREKDLLAPMHTHEFALADVAAAIEAVAGETPGVEAICVSVHPSH